MFLRILKQITHTRSSHTDKHLYKIRTGNREERNTRFSCHGFCKQCLSCSRRSHQKNTLRDSGSHLNVFLRTFQEIYDFFQFFFFLLKPCNLRKFHLLIRTTCHTRTALSKVHRFCIGTAALSVHHHKQENHNPDHQKSRKHRGHKP